MIDIHIWPFPLSVLIVLYTVLFIGSTIASVSAIIGHTDSSSEDYKWMLSLWLVLGWISAAMFTGVITIDVVK